MDRDDIASEMQRASADLRTLLDNATSGELRRGSNGTKWTNEQLLFHMLSGYLLVRNLLIPVRIFSRLLDGYSRAFARLLNAGTRLFHTINHLGSLGGARVLGHARLERVFDRVVAGRTHRVDEPPEQGGPGSRNALPRRLGPLRPGPHDPGRRLPLLTQHYGTAAS